MVFMFYTKRLIDAREEKKFTQKDISTFLNLHKNVYGHYERGETIIPVKHLNTLSNLYNISLDYIFGFTNMKNYSNYRLEINKKLIGIRLKELRKKYNLTQADLAGILHYSKSTISGYEIGKNIIATPFLYDICKKYNISADYLLGKTDDPKYLK